MNTQLSSPETYDISRMVFAKPIKGSPKGPDGAPDPTIKFSRIAISTVNDDGTIGELVLPTTELFSFGVSPNIAKDTGKLNGYSLPLCLWNRDNPLPIEKAFSNKLEDIVERCKDHLLLDQTKEDTDKYDLDRSELKKLNNFIYWKREKGKIVDGTGPTLYPKLIESKKNNKIITSFFDPSGNEIDPLALIGKYCYVKAAVKIESIFVGAKIALQIKVYEAEVRLIDGGVKRLLKRPAADERMTPAAKLTAASPMDVDDGAYDNDDEEPHRRPGASSQVVHDDDDLIQDDDEPPIPAPVSAEPPARKQIRKLAKPKN
jgi:hypothetical protein